MTSFDDTSAEKADIDEMLADSLEAYNREVAWRSSQGDTGPRPPIHYLAISGGGDTSMVIARSRSR